MKSKLHHELLALATLALFAGACSPDEGGTTTTAPPATTTTTTTVPPITTTTIPPGLEPQVLQYDLTDRSLLEYDADHDVTIAFTDSSGLITPEGEATIATRVSGDQRSLMLAAGDDGTAELVQDFSADEGSVSFVFGGTELNQELTDEELRDVPIQIGPTLIGADGIPVDGRTGAPSYYEGAGRVLDVLQLAGPVFGPDPVDEGDSWTVDVRDPVLGTVTIEGTITEEVELDDGFGFAFELAAIVPDLPIETTLTEAIEQGQLPNDALSAFDPTALGIIGEDAAFTLLESNTQAAGTFDPERGVLLDYTVDSNLAFVVELELDGEPAEIEYQLDANSVFELTETSVATTFDMTSILDQFEADPFDLAFDAIPIVPGYGFDSFDEALFDIVVEKFDMTLTEIIAGFSFLQYVAPDGTGINVAAITNGGNFRGDPALAEGIAGFWAERNPTRVTISGTAAYRTSIEGDEWLFWVSDTHLFVLIGPRAPATEIMEAIIDSADPYLWQPGDCFDFRDFGDAVPFSPFGVYGMTHCSVNHQYEVLHSEVLPEGPDDGFPDDMGDRVNEVCGARFFEHTGAHPLSSSLDMIRYLPNPDEWDRGARYIACVIAVFDEDGVVTVDARLEGAGAEYPIELDVGVCLAGTVPVDCDQPHSTEIVSVETYDAPADAERPDFVDVFEELEELCSGPFDDYGVTDGPFEISTSSLTDMFLGWENGVRTYYCVAFAEDDNGFAVDVVGSFLEEWEEAPEQVDA